MNPTRTTAVAAVLALIVTATSPAVGAPADSLQTGAFSFALSRDLPATSDAVYEALTGDISGWWDHSISGDPLRLYIEPRPGGGFWEIFDASGDGVRHAEVTYARRGSLLRMEGPLGLTGHAIHLVTTYELESVGVDSSRLTVRVHAAGEMRDEWPEIVEATWRHFIDDRFLPFLADRQRSTPVASGRDSRP